MVDLTPSCANQQNTNHEETKTSSGGTFDSAFCSLSPIIGILLFIYIYTIIILTFCTVDLYKTIYWHTRTRNGKIRYYRRKLRTYLNWWYKNPEKGKVRFFASQTDGESEVSVVTWGDEHQALDPFYEVSFGSDEVRKYNKKTMLAYRKKFLKRYSGFHQTLI